MGLRCQLRWQLGRSVDADAAYYEASDAGQSEWADYDVAEYGEADKI